MPAPHQNGRDTGKPLALSGQLFQVCLAARQNFPLVSLSRQFCPEPKELRKLLAHARKTGFDTMQNRPGPILHSLAPSGNCLLDLGPDEECGLLVTVAGVGEK